jgi:hypothetical protein
VSILQRFIIAKAVKYECSLEIPNEEVKIFFMDFVMQWLNTPNHYVFYGMTKSLQKSDLLKFSNELKSFVSGTLSCLNICLKSKNNKKYSAII